jgi:hypothetical protein
VNGLTRLFLIAVLLAVALAGAALVAGYPSRLTPGESNDAARGEQAADRDDAGHGEEEAPHSGDDQPAGTGVPQVDVVPGVQVAQNRLRLALEHSTFASDAPSQPLRFRILDTQGRPVRNFEVQHERKLHLIVVRRDLAGFQHLHPTMKPDGTWTTGIDFGEGGTYRLFADFTRDGEQTTLGADVQVAGFFRPRPLRAPARMVSSDGGLEVALRADAASAGEDARLAFEVRDRGRVATDAVQPYLGAKGHLVALRTGDLAYLHTHPDSDELAFTLNYPSAGAYRLFVQFRYQGRVHTAAFTQAVSE